MKLTCWSSGLLAGFLLAAAASELVPAAGLALPNGLDRKTAAIAFDCHGVLFKFNYLRLAAIMGVGALAAWGGTKLFGARVVMPVVAAFVGGWALFGGWLLLQKRWYGGAPSVESYLQGDSLFKKALRRFWLFFANQFRPDPAVFAKAWELKRAGYKLVFASNTGKQAFTELRAANETFFSENGTELFDGFFYPGCSWLVGNERAQREQAQWLVKAHPSYFDLLFSFVREKVLAQGKEVVFIDDSPSFIARARQDSRFGGSLLFKGV